MTKILVTGSAGLVGSRYLQLTKFNSLYTPDIHELDITNATSLSSFFESKKPDVVINIAAYTDVSQAEEQRGDTNAACYQINTIGTQNLVKQCKLRNIFFVHISTDMVFPGSSVNKGPYAEDRLAETDSSKLCWYGYTKAEAERVVRKLYADNSAIVRITYPVRANYGQKLDFFRLPLKLLAEDKLYPLFGDQIITITSIDELCLAIDIIIKTKKTGVYHVSSPDTTSPFEIISYLADRLGKGAKRIKKGSLEKFIESGANPLRYPQYGGLKVQQTQKLLNMKFSSTEQIAEQLIEQGLGS